MVVMDAYPKALAAYLAGNVRQDDFAKAVGCTQAAISRYKGGQRFPDASTARAIEQASRGAVPFALWEREALKRLGVSTRPTEEKAA